MSTVLLLGTSRQNGRLRRRYFQMHFLNEKFCISIEITLKFNPNKTIDNKPAMVSNNSLTPNRRQTTIWNNAGLVYWHRCASRPEWVFGFTCQSIHISPHISMSSVCVCVCYICMCRHYSYVMAGDVSWIWYPTCQVPHKSLARVASHVTGYQVDTWQHLETHTITFPVNDRAVDSWIQCRQCQGVHRDP